MKRNSLNGIRILLVNTGSQKKRFILKKLKASGVEIICLNERKNWAQGLVDQWILADTRNFQTSHQAILDFLGSADDPRIDGVLTFWEDDVIVTAQIAEALGLPGVGVRAATTARDKFRFRSFLQDEGLPSVRARILRSEQDCLKSAEELKFPLIVKPVFGASSAYVTKVDHVDELLEAYRFISTTVSPVVESALHEGLGLMVEEYIAGDEVDIDIIVQNGKVKFWSITDNDRTEEPFFVEIGETIPSQLGHSEQEALLQLAEEVLERLGVLHGCIHFEAKSTKNGPVPIEVNLRMGGDEVYYFVKHAWGFDLIEGAALVASQRYIPPFKKGAEPNQYLRGKYILPPRSGVLTKVEIPKDVRGDGVREHYFPKKVGDAVYVPPEGFESLGWVIASGKSSHEAEERLTRFINGTRFEVAPFRATSSIGKTERRTPFSSARLRAPQSRGAVGFLVPGKFSRDDMRSLRVGVACNRYTSNDQLVELELSSVGDNIESTLRERGFQVRFLDFNNPLQVMLSLQNDPVDIIFNVCERVNDSSLLEPHAASVLDILQVPYTGSNPFTLALCIDKIRVKKLLSYHNISTPKWDYCYTLDDDIDSSLRYPRIIKPANSDNSIGITNDSVVTNEKQFRHQLEYVVSELRRPALVEEFIEGTEYDVSILGNDDDSLQVLPLSRSVFEDLPQGNWSIYAYDLKFGGMSPAQKGIRIERPPKGVSKKQVSLVTELAVDTYRVLGCSDYGRVEIRVDRDGNPYVLELNPNPSINKGDCLPVVAELVGMNYGDFLEEILYLAIGRFRDLPPYSYLQSPLL